MRPFGEQIGPVKVGFGGLLGNEPRLSLDVPLTHDGGWAKPEAFLDRDEVERLRDWLSAYLEDCS